MTVDIQLMTDELVEPALRTLVGQFGGPFDEDDLAFEREQLELGRMLVALDGGRVVGTLGSYAFALTVPGGRTVPAAGVTWAGVVATHRRRGLLRRMLDAQLDDVIARGEPIAILTASEGAIYSRFGYGPATWKFGLEVTPPAAPSPATGGSIELVQPDAYPEVLGAFWDRYRTHQHGEVTRSESAWRQMAARAQKPEKVLWAVAHRTTEGEVDGITRYQFEGSWDGHGIPDGTVTVQEIASTSPEADLALWRHLLDIDLVARVRAPVVDPAVVRWRAPDPRHVRVVSHIDHLWARVIDVPACLSARTYAVTGEVVLQVVDPHRPALGGTFRLEGGPDGARVERTDAAPQLRLGTPALSAAYLGGTALRALWRAGRVDVLGGHGALDLADRMLLAPDPPYCQTGF